MYATVDNIWFLVAITVGGLLSYFVVKLVNENIKYLSEYLRSKFRKKEIEHSKALDFRRKITKSVKDFIESIVLNLKCDSAILFEYSNGNSNIAGLPFLFLNATHEVNSANCGHISDTLQKLNVSLLSDFLIELEEEKLIIIENMPKFKTKYPIIGTLLCRNDIKSAAFSLLDGIDGSVGVLFVGSKKFNIKDNIEVKKEMISKSTKISSLLDYNNVGKYENR
jgi:S-adenosylmethionine synthetase